MSATPPAADSEHHFIIGTAGHIDHGKSSLVRALTGTDPDRLPEEKARGMTIDLGFAHLELPRPDGGVDSLGIVDVPGHADFVKNMVAGVGGIDVALIAVAADDSWMPQTEEHVQILNYLGVTRAVVALTKADLAEDLPLAELDVRDHLAGTAFAEAPLVATSATTGEGIGELREALSGVLASTSPPPDIGKPRLPVDRVFSVKGIGTVVTGTLIGGGFHKGQAALVQPKQAETRIRSLQSHSCELELAQPGCRTAIGLQGIAVASKQDKQGVARGDVVTIPGFGSACDTLGVRVEKLDREIAGQAAAARPLRHGQWVRFHHGGIASNARLFFAESGRRELAAGDATIAQLRFDQPVFAFLGDHFVLRDRGMRATIGGGVVLDPEARRRHFRSPVQAGFLTERAAAPDDPVIAIASLLARDSVVPVEHLLRRSHFADERISQAVDQLVEEGKITRCGGWLAATEWWADLNSRAAAMIDAVHRERPQAPGLPLAEFAAALAGDLPREGLLEVLIGGLEDGDFTASGKFIHRQSHRPTLPATLESAAASIRRSLAGDPVNPPGLKDLLTGSDAEQAFQFLLETGEVVRLDQKVALAGAAYQELAETVRRFISEQGPATAAQLRDATGTTRRVLIPLLERFDADRITVRQGDVRALPR